MTESGSILLYRARDATEAAMLVQTLENAGIPLAHTDGMSAIGVGELPTDAMQVDIWVQAEHAESGRRVIEEHQERAKEIRGEADEWNGAQCEESNAGSFEVCWKCQTPRASD